MEQARLIIAIALSVLVFVVWHFFFADKAAVQKSAEKKTESPPVTAVPLTEDEAISKDAEGALTDKTTVTTTDVESVEREPQTVTVETPLYRVSISPKGAAFTSFILKNYRETIQKDSPAKDLFPETGAFQSVLLGLAGKSVAGLDNGIYSTNFSVDTLNVKHEAKEMTFYWRSGEGVMVEKTYSFSPQSYLVGLEVAIKNGSDHPVKDQLFVALNGTVPTDTRAYGFEGPSALIDSKVQEVKIKKIADQNTYSGNVKWIALQDRYFLMSLIPEQVEDASLRLFLGENNRIEAQYLQPESFLQPGTQVKYRYYLFFGPKSMQILNNAGHDLGKAVNFGMFDFLAKPCVWLMNKLYSMIPNYGVAIIILTVLIKILLWPLGSKSYKSMSEMKKLQPLMKEIREKYKNDKKKMNEETMSLYRTYKINPLGGCLPMIVQIPVFFALYRMLYEAIELRHAPFFLWIDDLSAPDRLFRFHFSIPFMEPPYGIPVLTIIMGATMLLQQKMSPPMGDPTQAKMMMLMPIVFTFIFINFSSGLVLYWLVNNVLSIAQQYYIQKKFA